MSREEAIEAIKAKLLAEQSQYLSQLKESIRSQIEDEIKAKGVGAFNMKEFTRSLSNNITVAMSRSQLKDPTTPKIGGVRDMGSYKTPYTGGEPDLAWSTCVAPNPHPTPNQMHPTDTKYSRARYNDRREGTGASFKKSDDLRMFAKKFHRYSVEHGMDSVAWIVDPYDKSQCVNILKAYPRYLIEDVIKACTTQSTPYDAYDTENDKCIVEALYQSLSKSLETEMLRATKADDLFPTVFMCLVYKCQLLLHDHIEALEKKVKEILPTQFSQSNMTQYVEACCPIIKELVAAGQYNHAITKLITMNMMGANHGALDWQASTYYKPLAEFHDHVDNKLKRLTFLSLEDRMKLMMNEDLMPEDLFCLIKHQYNSIVNKGWWQPAKHLANAKKPAAYTLESKLGSGDGKCKQPSAKHPCKLCDSPDHWAKDCTNPKPGRKSNKKQSRTNKHKWERCPLPKWHETSPGPRQPQTKTVNNEVYHWCTACGAKGHWQKSHSMATHTGCGNDKVEHLTESSRGHTSQRVRSGLSRGSGCPVMHMGRSDCIDLDGSLPSQPSLCCYWHHRSHCWPRLWPAQPPHIVATARHLDSTHNVADCTRLLV